MSVSVRDQAAEVVRAHRRRVTGLGAPDCTCGWTWQSEDGPFQPSVHLVDALAAAGLLADGAVVTAEQAWDEAVASLHYEDGSAVDVVGVVNPYRTIKKASS